MPSLGLDPIKLTYEQWLQVWVALGLDAATSYLAEHGYAEERGMLRPTERALPNRCGVIAGAAIDYCCGEWDYQYDPRPRAKE